MIFRRQKAFSIGYLGFCRRSKSASFAGLGEPEPEPGAGIRRAARFFDLKSQSREPQKNCGSAAPKYGDFLKELL